MGAKHTSGPWHISDSGDWSANHDGLGSSCYQGIKDELGNVVALAVAHDSEPFSEPDTDAIARLIAAAPDLLKALQLAMPALEAMRKQWPRHPDDDSLDVVRFASAAISKATGEQT